MKKVCFCVPFSADEVAHGRLFAVYRLYAAELAGEGVDVTFLFSEPQAIEALRSRSPIEATYKLQLCDRSHKLSSSSEVLSYLFYEHLKGEDYESIFFPDYGGSAHICLQSKRTGLAFEQTNLAVVVLGSLNVEALEGLHSLASSSGAATLYLEKASRKNADLLLSPSFETLGPIQAQANQGCVVYLPRLKTIPKRHTLPDSLATSTKLAFIKSTPSLDELEIFLRALRFPALGALSIHLTCYSLPTAPFPDYLEARLNALVAQSVLVGFDIISTCDLSEVLQLSADRRETAISLGFDTAFPWVTWCFHEEGRLVLSNWAFGAEEGPESAQRDAEFRSPRHLAHRLQELLTHRSCQKILQPNSSRLRAILESAQRPSPVRAPIGSPKVSVCLVTHNRPELLEQALHSLRKQSYTNFEVLLVDDGSSDPQALAYLDQVSTEFAERKWKIFREDNRYLGAARNKAASEASGEYLLFMDDDNVAFPNEIEVFVKAALYSNSDICTCRMRFFSGLGEPDPLVRLHEHFLVGAVPGMGILHNLVGDANCLIRKLFFDKIGGFTEEYGLGHEDIELFNAARLAGGRIELVPEELAFYRVQPDSMLHTTDVLKNRQRQMRPYVEKYPDLELFFMHSLGMMRQIAIEQARPQRQIHPQLPLIQTALHYLKGGNVEELRTILEVLNSQLPRLDSKLAAAANFDLDGWQAYLARYPDLGKNGVSSQLDATLHYLLHGFYERRRWG